MGFFDGWDNQSVTSRKSHKHRSSASSYGGGRHRSASSVYGGTKYKSRSRSRSRHRSASGTPGIGAVFGLDSSHHDNNKLYRSKHNQSRASLFGNGDSYRNKHSQSRSSFFGLNNSSRGSFFGLGRSSPSFYRRFPRKSFMQRAYKQLKRLLRDLVYYAKRHPMKVLMLVIMPLITGGFLTALLARFGLRLPPNIEKMMGIAATAAGGNSAGLVGEAVRYVSSGSGSSHYPSSSYNYQHSTYGPSGYSTSKTYGNSRYGPSPSARDGGYGHGGRGGYGDDSGYGGSRYSGSNGGGSTYRKSTESDWGDAIVGGLTRALGGW